MSVFDFISVFFTSGSFTKGAAEAATGLDFWGGFWGFWAWKVNTHTGTDTHTHTLLSGDINTLT